jgi:hypothetical protein
MLEGTEGQRVLLSDSNETLTYRAPAGDGDGDEDGLELGRM